MIFKFDFIKILAPFLKRVGVWLKFEIKKLNDLLQCMPKWRNMEIIIGGSELKSYLTIKRLHIAQFTGVEWVEISQKEIVGFFGPRMFVRS